MNKKKWNAKSIILYISITLILLLIYEVFNYYNTLQIVSIERQETNQAILKQIKTNVESNLLKIDHISYNIVSDSDNIRFVDWKTQGQNRRTTKLTPDIIRYIRESYNGLNAKELGREFNISAAYVIDIVNRKYWKNIT